MICEHLDSCALIYQMNKIVPFTVNMTKIKYCEFDKHRCARYKLLRIYEMDELPYDLWPGDDIRGVEMMESKLRDSHEKLYGHFGEEMPF